MTKQDNVTADAAVAACVTLSAFLTPMLKQARRDGDIGSHQFFSSMVADLGALREALTGMQQEDCQEVRSLEYSH